MHIVERLEGSLEEYARSPQTFGTMRNISK
jgi:hypothetical protein